MPPAPPGLLWWDYKNTVPPLPDPGTVNPAFTGYGWRYDPNWRPTTYTYNNMDQAGRPTLACSSWGPSILQNSSCGGCLL